MLRRLLRLLGWSALVLVLALATLPARQAWRVAAPHVSGVALYEVEGTLWSGHAVADFGALRIDNLHWTLNPFALALAAPRGEVTGTLGAGTLAGRYAIDRQGGLTLRKVAGGLPAQTLTMIPGVALLRPQGQVDVRLDELRLVAGTLRGATGTLHWRQATLALGARAVTLGDLQAALRTEGERLVAQLGSGTGPVELAGQLVLTGNRYVLRGTIRARDDAPTETRDALRLLGTPDAEGRIPLQAQGRLGP